MPQVRFRYPFWKDRLVPYVLAGAGGAFMQFNDQRPSARGQSIEAQQWRFTATAGVGLEYFFADNVAFVLEGKYLWADPLEVVTNGRGASFDASSALATLGLRIFLDENTPTGLAEADSRVPSRIYGGFRFGVSWLTDNEFSSSLRLEPESSAFGDEFNVDPGLSLGMNFGEHWGIEIAGSNTEMRLWDSTLQGVGEYALYTVIPQVRLRYPLGGGRWVPYASAGVGVAYGEVNDQTGIGDADGRTLSPAFAIGAGLEYFLARNVSFSGDLWWQYVWGQQIKVRGQDLEGDLSSLQFQIGFRIYLAEWR
jgi:opacity protein-like surface antigen